MKGVYMAYRKTFIIRELSNEQPIVSEKNFNDISNSFYDNQKRLTIRQKQNDLPDSFYHCITWLAYLYERAFKELGEFCPITTSHFMVRFFDRLDAERAIKKLNGIIAEYDGLHIDVESGG